MSVDERTRRVMTEGLVQVLGEEVTDALLAHLPPVGWGDVATTQDVEHLRAELRADMNQLRAEFQRELRGALAQQTRTFILAMVFSTTAAVFTAAGLAFAAARLT